MITRLKILILIYLFGLFVILSSGQQSCPEVNYVTPTEASTEGGSALMIFGCGFEQSAFVLPGTDPNFGNRVFLRNAWQTFQTELIEEGGNMIKFSSPKVPEDTYTLVVSIAGVFIPKEKMCRGFSCTIKVRTAVTPVIENISPVYAQPDSLIGMNGTIFTSRFSSNLDVFTVGKPQSIIRIYDGPGNCEPQKPNSDEYYGIELIPPGSNKGYIICKRNITYIGSINVTFIVDSPYGRSTAAESIYRVDRNEKTYMHQAYSVIKGVSPPQTSASGGGLIEISGEYLGPQGNVRILVGYTNCSPVRMNSTVIQCILDQITDTSTNTFYPGNRGSTVQFWSDLKASTEDDLLKLNFSETSSATLEKFLHEPEFIPSVLYNGTGTARLITVFVAPKSSEYQFIVSSVNAYVLLGGRSNETLARMSVVNGRTKSIYLQRDEIWILELRTTLTRPTVLTRLCASMLNTSLNYQQLKASKPTSYTISLKSNGYSEKQVVNHSALFNSPITPISEIQTFSIPSDAMQYKLCLFSSCTVPLPVQSPNVDQIKSEINEKFGSSSTTVRILGTTSDYFTFEVTFPKEFGDIPPFEVRTIRQTVNKALVNETVKGMTGFTRDIRPSYGGMYSYNTYTLDSTEAEIRSAYLSLGSSWCPPKLINPPFKYAVFDDFENSTRKEVTTEAVAFCGRQCVENLFTYVFDQVISVNTNPFLCFAVKGKTQNIVTFVYNAIGINTRLLKQSLNYAIDLTLPQENVWKYKCIDVLQVLRSNPLNVNATIFQLESFGITPRKKFFESQFSVHLDTVYMGPKAIYDDANDVATWPRFPKQVFSDVTVIKSATSGVFTVEITTKSCLENFDLFGLAGVPMQNNNSTVGQVVIIRDERWPTPVLSSVIRTQAASPPMNGYYVLSFKGVPTSRIPARFVQSNVVERILNLHPHLGTVRVTRTGVCRSFQYVIWLDSLPGDQPEISVSNQTKLIGDAPQVTVQKSSIGELVMCPLSGDMLATRHTVPQVRLYVDNVPAFCESSCSHQFVDLSSPTVDSATIQVTDNNLTLVLTGTGFTADSPELYELFLMIDKTTILKQWAFRSTTTQLHFFNRPLKDVPIGSFIGRLRLHGKGFTSSGFKISLGREGSGIVDIIQTGLFKEDKEVIKINGSRFLPNYSQVYFDNTLCGLEKMTTTEITCLFPIIGLSGQKMVKVQQPYDFISKAIDFNVSRPNAPVILSVQQQQSASVSGTTQVIINGLRFTRDMLIFVGGVRVQNFTFVNETQIIMLAPPQKINGEKLIALFDSQNILISPEFSVVYQFELSSIQPQIGSFMGGQIINIDGEGFDNQTKVFMKPIDDKNQLCFDRPASECEILLRDSRKIQCKTGSLVKTHYVFDSGVSSERGVGYEWQPKTLTIIQGDSVVWIWNTTTRTNPIMVAQATDIEDLTPFALGFHSGQPTMKGIYSFNFTEPGTYYYMSSNEFVMMGIIEVRPFDDCITEVVVQTQYSTAIHKNVSVTTNWDSVAACAGGLSCNSLPKPAILSAKHGYVYRGCATPLVSSFSPFSLYAESQVEVTSDILSQCTDQVIITVGGANCISPLRDNNSVNSIKCTLQEDQVVLAGLTTGQPLRPSVFHKDFGMGLLTVSYNEFERYAFFLPRINCAKTNGVGSTQGGGQFIIYGSGFVPNNTDLNVVTLRSDQKCLVIQATPGYIKCLIPVPTNTSIILNNVGIQVMVKPKDQNQWVEVEQNSPDGCIYSYSLAATPIVKTIEPRELSSNDTLRIGGSNLLLPGENVSSVQVYLDNASCVIDPLSSNASLLLCQVIGSLPAGNVNLRLLHQIRGNPKYETSLTLKSKITILTVDPKEGSFAGGTVVKLTGNGLNDPTIKIYFGSETCQIIRENRSASQIYCVTPSQISFSNLTDYKVAVNVSSGYSLSDGFTYVNSKTPRVSTVAINFTPVNGTSVNQLNIYGSMLQCNSSQGKQTEVKYNQRTCVVQIIRDEYIQCYITNMPSDQYQLAVNVPEYGFAISDFSTKVDFSLNSINASTGGTNGGLLVEIQGVGMDAEKSTVTICEQPCTLAGGSSLTLKCITPKITTQSVKSCDVVVTVPTNVGVLQKTLSSAFVYDPKLTPTVVSVDPLIGGTGGGTNLTLIGIMFDESTKVSVGGTQCQIISINDTTITCQTGVYNRSEKVPIDVITGKYGKASGNFIFYYVDRWSSRFTWNNEPIPKENDFVVINQGQNVMLDTNTPVLSMLLINGGTLFFDPTKDVQLHAKYILILNNGKFLIGSPEEPYTKMATITLHGHVREKELPLYGAKVLALRNGTLSIHGKPRIVTWTRLTKTAEAGTKTLALEHPVDWQPGERIIITSTGGKSAHNQSEEHIIADISSDNRTITLTSPLAYRKLGVKITYSNGVTGNFAAEVGLLTRNILITGTNEPVVSSDVPRCTNDFSTGQFATHTCVIGDPGEQLGASEYGGHVHIGGPYINSGAVKAYISYAEFYFMGQAYRLGRYPIHFHLNGLMNGSYVRGCSVHKSFNRAINIHNTHEVLVENNVVYDVMGGAFFLEDGIEYGNVIQYNLLIHVKRTSSLLNDDVVPAAFWITQPNNTVQHNVAASGTHFGFWYRMLENPNGPSSTTTVCPRKIPLGKFENNTVHSQGWFALWIHESFFPTTTGGCTSTKWDKAVFRKLTAWNNNKGPECVNCGGVQFEDMLLVNNDEAAIEGKRLMFGNLYDQNTGPFYRNSTIVAFEPELTDGLPDCHTRAVILPWSPGLTVENMVMRNFNGQNCTAIHGTVITCLCNKLCGGYEYLFRDIKWENTSNRAEFRWHGDFSLRDLDGSLTDGLPDVPKLPGSLIIGKANHLPADKCGPSAPGAGDLGTAFGQGVIPGVRCLPDVTALRFAVDQVIPARVMGNNMTVTLLNGGTEQVPFKTEALTDKQGWMTTLVNNRTYVVNWNAVSTFSNLSYIGYLENFRQSDYVIVRHMGMTVKPDRVQVISGQQAKPPLAEPLDPSKHVTGDVFYNETGNYIEYIVKAPANPTSFNSHRLWVSFYKCFFTDCVIPTTTSTTVQTSRPADALFWSKSTTWNTVLGPQPTNGSSLTIPKGTWLVLDTSMNIKLEKLLIYGTLEVDSGTSQDQRVYKLAFKQMLIIGGQFLAGPTAEMPLTNATLELTLLGSVSDDSVSVDGPVIGPKSIGVYGVMSMHALPKKIMWTNLRYTATAGENQIRLNEPVTDWSPGNRIVIATTSMDFKQSELHEIASISPDLMTITLVNKLLFTHVAYNQTYGSHLFTTGAEVGLLTSNIIVQGDNQSAVSRFGGRILASQTLYADGVSFGQIKLSGVYFYRMGQKDFSTPTDARFPVSFISAGDMTNISYIKSCIFEESLSSAVGAFGTTGVLLENNIFYKTLGSAIWVKDKGHKLIHNLLIESLWSGETDTKNQNLDILFEAALDIKEASDLTLQGNAIAGAERVCIYTQGYSCYSGNNSNWKKNTLHSCLIGFMQLKTQYNCSVISNSQIYSVSQFSMFWRTDSSIQAKNIHLVDNAGGMYPFIGEPSGRTHMISSKDFRFDNSLLVGRSGIQSCSDKPNDMALQLASKLKGPTSPEGGYLGMTSPQFMSSIGMPEEGKLTSWSGDFSNGGAAFITNLTIANYGTLCSGKRDYVWRTDMNNEDGIFPTYFVGTNAISVDSDSITYYDRPKVGNVRFDKCNDMECDGLKKILVIDKDGGLFGQPTVVVPQSEWQYNLDSSYGVSDKRIPKRMLMKADGTSIDPAKEWPNKGIIRDSSCVYMATMQAYKCSRSLDHRILLIESMDPDALERRLSPIAFATQGLSPNYIDLINGPSDHGACSSYACLKRMSTFMAVVARQKNFVMYMTSTMPQELRLRLPQAEPDYAVRIGIDYFTAGRLDVYKNGEYVKAKNSITNSLGQSVLQAPKTVDEFMPNVTTDSAGTNYYDDSSQMLYVILKGESIITIKLSQLVKVSFGLPAMTIDQFFGSEVVSNLAKYLGIPAENIRVVKVVSESSTNTASRRRRSVPGVFVELEISSPPSQNLSQSATPNVTSSGITSMEKVSADVISIVQTGLFEKIINATVVSVSVQQPTPLPSSPLWSALVSNSSSVSPSPTVIQIPTSVSTKLFVPAGYDSVTEGIPFSLEISTLDSSGKIVRPLGTNASVWSYELYQPESVSPIKVSKTNFDNPELGTALVTNLIFSRDGLANLFVSVISPNDSSRLNSSINFLVKKRNFGLLISSVEPNADVSTIKSSVNNNIPIQVKLLDKQTGTLASNVNWRYLRWNFTGDLCPNSRKPTNAMTNSASSYFYDPTNTNGSFNWAIGRFQSPWIYVYCISATAYLNDSVTRQPGYDIGLTKLKIHIRPQNYTEPPRNVVKPFTFKFAGSYSTMLQHIDEFTAAVQSELFTRYPNVAFENMTFSEGSIVVNVVAVGESTATIDSVLNSLITSLNNGSISFSIAGVNYTAPTTGKNDGCRTTGFVTSFIMLTIHFLFYQIILKNLQF